MTELIPKTPEAEQVHEEFLERCRDGLDKFRRLAGYSGMPLVTSGTLLLSTFLPSKGTEKAHEAALQFVALCPECGNTGAGKPTLENPDGYPCGKCNGTGRVREHHFITFAGETGRGKTHLAIGIGWFWIGQNIGVVKYWHVGELLDAIRAEYDYQPKSQYGIPLAGELEKCKAASLLILDDLGAEKTTDWVVEKLDMLINHRWIEQKPTVFTTNLAPDQLPPRLRSRIKEGVTVTLEGIDYREYKAKLRRQGKVKV